MVSSSKFFSAIYSQSIVDTLVSLDEIVKYLSSRYSYISSCINNQNHIYDKLVKTFLTIGKILMIEFDDLNITRIDETYTRTMNKTTFRNILQSIHDNDVHQNVKISSKKYSCSFHTEPLIDHLAFASIISGIHAINANLDDNLILIICFTALLHDIGKPACIHVYGKHLGYPFHGENTCAMILRAYNNKFAEYFNLQTYLAIARSASIHMCSYHVSDFTLDWNILRASSIAYETDLCKIILEFLSFGDTFGKVPDSVHLDDTQAFLDSRIQWKTAIGKHNPLHFNKFTIIVNGRSNSGKSTIVDIIVCWLHEHDISVGVVSRDVVLCNLVASLYPTELDFTLRPGERPTGAQYAACFALYEKYELGSKVNSEMKISISASINQNTFTIIDTQATMFSGIERILPQDVTRTNRISIVSMINFMTDIDDKNGVSEQKQLSMTGCITSMSPMDYNNVDLIGMQSSYCNNTDASEYSCEYVFPVVGTNLYKNEKSMGLSLFFDHLEKMFIEIKNTDPDNFVDTSIMTIGEYVRFCAKKFNNNFEKMCEHFRKMQYNANAPYDIRQNEEWKERVLHLKYMEHNMNWNKWGRGARGTALMQMSNLKWFIIKMLMQRGAEALTGYQVDRGFTETENCNLKLDSYARHLSADQQALLCDLILKKEVNLVASFKKDGSLLCFALYTGEVAENMRSIIMSCADNFTKTVMQTWDNVVGHTNSVLVMMSQGTMWIGEDMQWYNTTALFPEACGQTLLMTPEIKIKTFGPSLFLRLSGLFSELKGEQKMLIFETICKHRTSDNGVVHTELAISYETSSYTLLSATEIYHNDTVENEYVYVPHYKFSELISKYRFIEPAFWYVKSTLEMDQLVRSIGDVIYRRITKAQFYERHPPANKYGYEMVIDYEGFVVYDLARNDSYSKIKTDEYYDAHKFREKNVLKLCELADVAGDIFPLASKVKYIYTTMDESCKKITNELCEILDISDELRSELPEKARGALTRLGTNKAGLYKILINNCRTKFGKLGANVFYKYFPSLSNIQSDTFEIKTFVVGYAMQNEIWNPMKDDKIIVDDIRKILIGALINNP